MTKVRVRRYARRNGSYKQRRPAGKDSYGEAVWKRRSFPPGIETEHLVLQGKPQLKLVVTPWADEGWMYEVYEVSDPEILYADFDVGEPIVDGIVESKQDAQQAALIAANQYLQSYHVRWR